MSAPEFKVGELVDITIKGARVDDISGLGECELGIALDTDMGDFRFPVPLGPPEVTVARVAPPEWPPQPGDMWREDQPEHKGGPETWFAQRYRPDYDDKQDSEGINDEGWRIVLIPLNGGPYGESEKRPEQLLGARLTLVHREDPAQRARDFEIDESDDAEGGEPR